jgi:hypothetical protein
MTTKRTDPLQRRRPRAPRGATLIEMMVAFSLLAVILSVTVGLVVGAIQSGARGRARGELARQGEFINTLMSNELRMAGFGVPSSAGTHIDDSYAGAGATTFESHVILATPTAIGIVADLPRPDAQYGAFGTIDNRPSGSRSNVMWHTENNGSCAPLAVGPSCDTAATSAFFPGETGCGNVGAVNDRVCPWGMKRVIAGERIQVVSGALRWTHGGVASPLAMSALGPSNVLSLNLSTTWAPIWPSLDADDPPNGVSGQGFVTTIDRVFYQLVGTDIVRIQCFGDPDPQSARWPNLATNTMPSLADLELTPVGGTQNTCVGPEVVARNVASLQFGYFTGDGSVAAAKSAVRRVDWTLKLRKIVNRRAVEQDVVGTVGIRN